MKRERKQSRLKWFPFDCDAFYDDPRMQYLTAREKSFWANILIKSFRTQGIVVTDPSVIAEQTGATKREAKELIAKLLGHEILRPTAKLFEAVSNRMAKEANKARESYEQTIIAGKARAEQAQRDETGKMI
jgi:hypothetical protein